MEIRAYLIHALSPLHAGTGQGVDTIDLPIARQRATGIPVVPSSSIKGVLRDRRASSTNDKERLWATFGPDSISAAEHAGALVVGDARLLALPVRSFRGTFAWVTSPLLLMLARRDLTEAGVELELPSLDASKRCAKVTAKSHCFHHDERVYLEDLDLPAKESAELDAWAARLAPLVSPGASEVFARRLVLVDDETMTFLWETATQIDARIRLDEKTRTVAHGQLWLEESLPAETLLIGLFAADRGRGAAALSPAQVMQFALGDGPEQILQFGGKATTGRGRCRLLTIAGERQP